MRHLRPVMPVVLLCMAMATPTTLADIGSKHKDQHTRDKNKPISNVPNEPFDFSELTEHLDALHTGAVEEHLNTHVDQAELEALPAGEAFIRAFEEGDELFEISFNALDGVGINVGNGKRFSSIPRLDLEGGQSWANVIPHRITGPNSDSCLSCHNQPVADGAGGINDNTVRIDPERIQKGFIERQAPHIYGMGGLQLLAQEMTTELQSLRNNAITESCDLGRRIQLPLVAKGIEFGSLQVQCNRINYRDLEGIDSDLVVKPFEWKGLTAFVRDFVRGASHQELGMQATELVGNVDNDFDGVINEFSIGDITALAVYVEGQQRPVTKLELNQVINQLNGSDIAQYGLPLTSSEIYSIENGAQVFNKTQCSSCHTASLTAESAIFSEPSEHPDYRDDVFPAGENFDLPSVAITFDITQDIFVNSAILPSGQTLGQFERDSNGAAVVRLYGDLKRHDMGRGLAEEIDEGNVGASVFMTENLWGVGSTPPYLHDGRATTLTEAILLHGGEALSSKEMFAALSDSEKLDLIAFLDNLVVYIDAE